MKCNICEYLSVCFPPLKLYQKLGGVCKQGRVKRNTAKGKNAVKTSERKSKSAKVLSERSASMNVTTQDELIKTG